MTSPAKRGTGRPAVRPNPLDPGIVEAICDRLVAGEGINSISRDPAMPSMNAIYLAMANDDGFRSSIARAREAQQEALIDATVDMADAATADDWQVVKLRIWARQWRAGKLAPRKYGERLEIDQTVSVRVQSIADRLDAISARPMVDVTPAPGAIAEG